MATIGVFAMNMSPRSGGVYSLTDGLMANAHLSRHRFVYLCPVRGDREALPDNVELIERPDRARFATQAALNLPHMATLLRGRSASKHVLAACAGVAPGVFDKPDAWLWPHAFMPIANLRRTMVICHDMIHHREPDCFSRGALARRAQAETALPRCETILCPSQATANDLLDAYPALRGRTRVFHEAPSEVMDESQCRDELDRIKTQFGRTPIVLFVGVDWPHKNHQLLIDAAKLLKTMAGPTPRIVFVGHRRTQTIGQAIAEAGVGDMVIDEGAISRTRLAALYRSATVFAFPSRSEGFGIPLVEAMQCGLPIVASDRTCIPEICGKAAVLLPPADARPWAEAIHTMLTDPAHRGYHAALSRRRGEAFSWSNTWRQLDEVFNAVDVPKSLSA